MSTQAMGLKNQYLSTNASCHGDEVMMLFKSCMIPLDAHYTSKPLIAWILTMWNSL